ncbi:MAG: alpha-amylase family glycosyl hydrolase [bacterium]
MAAQMKPEKQMGWTMSNHKRHLRSFGLRFLGATLLVGFLSLACQEPSRPEANGHAERSTVKHPEWSRNLSIYEVNLRQYSDAGTFQEFEKHLPRLKEMGVGILWFMPIHPIGEINRKGTLGSYYSVKDYFGVNHAHGTMADFERLVRRIHKLGMYVILDWVANHTAWDNALATEHPEWYMTNEDGNFVPPVSDWSDVIDLNYDNRELRQYQIRALKYWVVQADIDGYRFDVAGMVPMDFWNEVRQELEKIKPIFMLAETEGPEFHEKSFDMTYGWELHHVMNEIAAGRADVTAIDSLMSKEAKSYPGDAYRMYFTSNHDENSWNGTVFERLGQGAAAFAVLSATLKGMPLIYSGQEAGLAKRLDFFEKDVIDWREHEFARLYTTLLNLKKVNKALWNGEHGGEMQRLATSNDESVFAFARRKEGDAVLAVFNLSDQRQSITLEMDDEQGEYKEIFSREKVSLAGKAVLELAPWGYKVFVKRR